MFCHACQVRRNNAKVFKNRQKSLRVLVSRVALDHFQMAPQKLCQFLIRHKKSFVSLCPIGE